MQSLSKGIFSHDEDFLDQPFCHAYSILPVQNGLRNIVAKVKIMFSANIFAPKAWGLFFRRLRQLSSTNFIAKLKIKSYGENNGWIFFYF